jgi:hypothetical protein
MSISGLTSGWSAGRIRDALGVVADPLELARNLDRRDQPAQGAGHRLLRRHDSESVLFQRRLGLIDVTVVGDDSARGLDILLPQGADGARDRDDHHLPKRAYLCV